MTTIAIPQRGLVLPPFTFPAWVKRIGDPLKMLAPLGGMLTPLAVPNAAPWWLAGGISSANCKAAYQAKGATGLSASYSNLNSPGTNDAAPGVAPTWNATDGWIFNGSTQYLTTGITPAAGYAMFMQFTNRANGGIVGSAGVGNDRFYLWADQNNAHLRVVYGYGSQAPQVAPSMSSGNLGLVAGDGYRNGTKESTFSGSFSGTPQVICIGALGGSSVANFCQIDIQAFAIYSSLTAAQATAVAAAMAAL